VDDRLDEGADVKDKASIARRIGLGVAALGATLLTASCAAGQHAASAQEHPSINGTNAEVGSIDLRAVAVVAPSSQCYRPGADAPLTMSIVNTGRQPDSLTGVSSPRFSSYTVAKTADDLAPASGTGDCASPSASASGSASSAPAQPAAAPQTVAPGKALQLGLMDTGTTDPGVPTAPIVVLSGLKGGPLYPGESIPVTFSFADAGQVTLQIPVQLSAAPNNSVIPSVPNGTNSPIE
jgi:copper(I)-binding protein